MSYGYQISPVWLIDFFSLMSYGYQVSPVWLIDFFSILKWEEFLSDNVTFKVVVYVQIIKAEDINILRFQF